MGQSMTWNWWLYLFLGAMGTIDIPTPFQNKEACIEHGTQIIEEYKEHHPSAGFFWCVPALREKGFRPKGDA